MQFLKSLKLNGLLSFAPDSPEIPLSPLNVLIGPNGSGKSNLLESLELLHATPRAFAEAIRDGGGAKEWLWKGNSPSKNASIEALLSAPTTFYDMRYKLSFAPSGQRTEVVDETLEEERKRRATEPDVFFYYRFQNGNPVINLRDSGNQSDNPNRPTLRHLERQSLLPDESVLSQRKDPDLYPELTWVGRQFGQIQMFREWGFGRYTEVRKPQQADLPSDSLLPNAINLGLVLNRLEHSDAGPEFNRILSLFLPRFHRFSTLIQGSTVQFFLHEHGLKAPIPATRLSDGTIRFMALLAVLLSPEPPPLICIEEPELGLHPDALSVLGNLLVEASTRTQVIVTTHSDALISALTEHVESVLVCEYRDGTVINRLESAKLGYWLDKYRLGEVWRIGELGGNP